MYDTQLVNYHYLNDEHLISVDGTGGTRSFYYDALGRCVKRVGSGATTYYIHDGEKPIVEYTSSTGIVGRNVYGKGIDEILMRTNPGVNSGQPYYYAQDHEGSVTHLINGCTTPSNQTGNVLEKYAYDAFGWPWFMDGGGNNLNPNATAYNNRFLFTGREYAATYRGIYVQAFRFYEYRARAYHPDLGRFMSEDPKGFDAGDYNLFRYCHNDPVDFSDPMGLSEVAPAHSPREESYDQAMARAQWRGSNLMHADTAGGAISIGATGYNSWSASRSFSMAQIGMDRRHYSKQSEARTALAHSVYDEQESMSPRREYSAYVSQSNDEPRDFITSDSGRGSIGTVPKESYGHEGYKNYSLIPVRDPSPEGYHRVAVVYSHLNWRKDIDIEDRRAFFGLRVNATLATPAQPGSNLRSPNIINWDWATGGH